MYAESPKNFSYLHEFYDPYLQKNPFIQVTLHMKEESDSTSRNHCLISAFASRPSRSMLSRHNRNSKKY